MKDPDDTIREQLVRMLLEDRREISTSTLARIGRTAWSLLGAGRLIRKKGRTGEDVPVDVEKLAKIVSSIGGLKGVAMKMGQIMSYIDVAMPEDLRAALSVLQTHAQPMAFDRVREIVRAEIPGKADELLLRMGAVPVAAASIGQVHRAELSDGTPVAVKVQYPEIEEAIKNDFRPAAVGTKIASLFFPHARVESFVEEARTRFLEECDYLHEAKAQERFARLFAGDPVVLVPEVHPTFCSRRVFVSTFVEGRHFEEYLQGGPPREDRDRIGAALFGFYVGTLFRHGLYNCDPHPGNYVFLPDGRVAILDYGCTRRFEPDFLKKLAALTRAVQEDDHDGLHRAFLELGLVREGRQYDFDTARALLRSFHGPMLKDEILQVDLGEAIDFGSAFKTKRQLLKLTLPAEFVFLFRIRFGLLSVLARLGARANWHQLERGYLRGE
jgi:predicted unusual protein kinase regulating ubiquinone biosynthesis (AarF/ABC1/UbiB family)